MSRDYAYPDDAACAGNLQPLWDAHVEGETNHQRDKRQALGKAVCKGCPVQVACIQAVDPMLDDGVRGGVVLESLSGRRPYGGYGSVQGITRAPWGSKRQAG